MPLAPRKSTIDRAESRSSSRTATRRGGADIVYVHATHGYLLAHFLDPQTNTRGDEYGGSLHNRIRVLRELVGAGPAGLEAARAMGVRGYRVALAEAARVPGGRVVSGAALSGMRENIHVRDHHEQQLLKMPDADIFLDSRTAP